MTKFAAVIAATIFPVVGSASAAPISLPSATVPIVQKYSKFRVATS